MRCNLDKKVKDPAVLLIKGVQPDPSVDISMLWVLLQVLFMCEITGNGDKLISKQVVYNAGHRLTSLYQSSSLNSCVTGILTSPLFRR